MTTTKTKDLKNKKGSRGVILKQIDARRYKAYSVYLNTTGKGFMYATKKQADAVRKSTIKEMVKQGVPLSNARKLVKVALTILEL